MVLAVRMVVPAVATVDQARTALAEHGEVQAWRAEVAVAAAAAALRGE